MESLWVSSGSLPKFKPLEKDINTDVLIVGGGLAGILCAYMLHEAGVDYALAEAEEIFDGISKNTTAKITSQHGLIYDKIYKKYGLEKAGLYLEANQNALGKYRELCRNIDCDFETKDAYVYSLDGKGKIRREQEVLKRLGFDAETAEALPLPLEVSSALRFKDQAQLHPIKFVREIAADLNIYEHTKVRELRGLCAITKNGKINAKRIVVATHFPMINKHGLYPLKLYQHRSYVLALEGAQNVDGMYIDESLTGLSFRNYGELLLLGGGSHRTGCNGGSYRALEKFAGEHYPQAKIKYRWATQDCMSLDSIPYIGRYSEGTDGLYVATGFNKWGMTSSMVSAQILTDMLTGKKSKYEELFSPSRSVFHPQLIVNSFEAIANILTPTTRRCPHLGCALKWNAAERTWDCPCHGSRFTEDGKLIDNPSTADLK